MHFRQCRASASLSLLLGWDESSCLYQWLLSWGCHLNNILGRCSSYWVSLRFRWPWLYWDAREIDECWFPTWWLWLCTNQLPLHMKNGTFVPIDDFDCVEGVGLFVMSPEDLGVGPFANRLIESDHVVIDFLPCFGFAHSDIIVL